MKTAEGLFQLLETPVSTASFEHILGSVVSSANYTIPLRDYAPYYDSPQWETEKGKKEKEILDKNMKRFWEKPADSVPLSNLLSSRDTTSSDKVKFKLTEILKAYFNEGKHQNFTIENGKTVQYHIDNVGAAVSQRLSKCQPWKDEVQKLYDRDIRKVHDRQYLIVAGVWVCETAEVSWNEDATSKKELESTFPTAYVVSPATGVPLPPKAIDLEGEGDRSREQHQRGGAEIRKPAIFAVSYHVLDLILEEPVKKSSSFIPKLKFKKTNSDLSNPKIKGVSLGKALRGGPHSIGSYGHGGGSNELLYWEEPDYISPDELETDADASDADGAPDGMVH